MAEQLMRDIDARMLHRDTREFTTLGSGSIVRQLSHLGLGGVVQEQWSVERVLITEARP